MQHTQASRNLIPVALLSFLGFAIPGPAAAKDRPLFERQETLIVRLEAPLSTLRQERSEENELDGLFHYTDEAGVEQTLDVKVSARGRFRRKKEICDFPPLRLNFRKSQVKGTEFRGQDKLKLVTHCENDRDSYEQNLLQEFLAYRILNLLTDRSFRVRLLHVDYIDSGNGKLFRSKFAFLIEDEDEMGERLGLQRAKVNEVSYDQLDPRQTALFGVFQYMIGNTDFSAVRGPSDTWCCHNAVPVVGPDGLYLPVPYDLDFAGLVDARYAAPRPGLKIKDVKDRQYRGLCRTNDLLPETLALFASQRSAINDLINRMDGMTKGTRRLSIRYLDDFFDDMTNPKKVEKNLLKECL